MNADDADAATAVARPWVRPMPRGLRRAAWVAGVPIVIAMTLGVYVLSFTGLFLTMRVAAHFPPTFALTGAVVLDLFITMALCADLILSWAGLGSAAPRLIAWGFASLSVAANFYAGFAELGPAIGEASTRSGVQGLSWHNGDVMGGVLHAAWPVMFVAVVEVVRFAIARWAKIVDNPKPRREVTRSRLMRWLFDPSGTFIMTRLRHMWLIEDEADALEMMRARKLAIARLRDRYGRVWKIQIPGAWRLRAPVEEKWAVSVGRLEGSQTALKRVAIDATRGLFAAPQHLAPSDGLQSQDSPPGQVDEVFDSGASAASGQQTPRHGSGGPARSTPRTLPDRKLDHEDLYREYRARLDDGGAGAEMPGPEIAERLAVHPGNARNVRRKFRERYTRETGRHFVVEGNRLIRMEVQSQAASHEAAAVAERGAEGPTGHIDHDRDVDGAGGTSLERTELGRESRSAGL